VLGLWLFVSAIVWPHTPAQRVNAWVVGVLAVTAALIALRGKKLGRYVNAALGGWLILTALLLPRMTQATFWNHLLVGAAMAFFALVADLGALRQRRADV
jgi:hypothetical protein